jgi:hypothetical protein
MASSQIAAPHCIENSREIGLEFLAKEVGMTVMSFKITSD